MNLIALSSNENSKNFNENICSGHWETKNQEKSTIIELPDCSIAPKMMNYLCAIFSFIVQRNLLLEIE